MVTTYKLNTSELESAFVDTIRATYPNQTVEIEVRDESDCKSAETGWDETAYLNSTAANRKHLDEAMKNVAEGKNLITFSSLEEARKRAEEWAANN